MSALTCYKGTCGGTGDSQSGTGGGCMCGAVNRCFSGCNNAHWKCPPMMADGRIWASWQPEAVINQRIQVEQGIQSNWEYRRFMQNNGLKIMNFNTLENCHEVGLDCNTVGRQNMEYSKSTPFLYRSVFDTRRPPVGYCGSDLKNPYLSSEQLNARLISPYIIPPRPIV